MIEKLRALKEVVIAVGVPVLLLLIIHANTIAARNAASTAQLVKSQGIVLKAIKEATEDGRLTAEQKSNLTICLLLVPQAERTTDTATNCRKQVEATPAVVSGSVSQIPQNSSRTTSVSSPNTTPTTTASQPDNSQTPQPTPEPTPEPTLMQRILNFINPFN